VSYVRDNFFYGREFLNDADLNQQALSWLTHKANRRVHRTTWEVPQVRFDRDERAVLRSLATKPYRSVGMLPLAQAPQPLLPTLPSVERRPLSAYARISGVRT
jgi:hypothetical protein